MKKFSRNLVITLLVLFSVFGLAELIKAAATNVDLLTADSFAVLAGSGITNTGATTITGDIGSYSTDTITGSPTVIGTNHAGDTTTQGAKTDLATAYGTAAGQTCDTDLTGQDLGGMTLTPGVYCFDTSAQLTGTLILNGQGDPNAVFVFKIGSTLTTASDAIVAVTNSAQECHIFWQVGSSATLGTGTNFKGSILALTSITLTTDVVVGGRVLAQNGAVTMDTNTITKPTCVGILRVIKSVVNNNGGTATADLFTMNITGTGVSSSSFPGAEDPGTTTTLTAGVYSVDETTYSGYTKSLGANCSGSIAAGETKICTITNTDNAPSLTLNKIVENNFGGSSAESAWTLTATGPTTLSGAGAAGSTDVVSDSSFDQGTYALSESAGPAGYTSSTWSCVKNGATPVVSSSIELGLGDVATCTITNSDVDPGVATLHLRKIVINDSGGTAVSSSWTLTATGATTSPTNLSGTASVDSTSSFKADTYTLAETGGPTGYIASAWVCVGGMQVSSTITVAVGQSATCTITNDDVAPQLIVTKTVINDNAGTKAIADFSFFIDGSQVSSTVASTTSVGLHTVSETADSGYTSTIGGACAADGTVTLAIGDVKTCTITNNDVVPPSSGGGGGSSSPYVLPVPPLIDIVKIPSPLALPAGAGPVTYTYTVRNIGTVPMNNITMVEDSCSPVNFVSGDTNADSKLDVTETWTYTCSTTLSKTHTNVVIATGWANGISTTDIATAIVVVGAPVVPPLIHITKVPNPLALLSGGGLVTYTKTVTNPGTVALSNVHVTDDKCRPIKYISGDTNTDSKLDYNESWVYNCQSNLTKTTVNTAVATGEANGLTARDFAIATVVVADAAVVDASVTVAPKFPDTGISPGDNNYSFGIFLLVGIFTLISVSLVIVLKNRKI